MSKPAAPLCFQCGQPANQADRINHLPSGEPCPTCLQRVLDQQPALLPGFGARAAVEARSRRPRASGGPLRALPRVDAAPETGYSEPEPA